MSSDTSAPTASYGVLQRTLAESTTERVVESVKNLGYGVLDVGFTKNEIDSTAEAFDQVLSNYQQKYHEQLKNKPGEMQTIRAMLTHGCDLFIKLALTDGLIEVVSRLIEGKFILNQQNGLINPPDQSYSQGLWHRDLPYQHFITSSALAVNALYCVDDFTSDNGATFVLPASHRATSFPSVDYVKKNALQVEASAGSFILLDCMTFHAGGVNRSDRPRRAINHIFNIPFFKQQITLKNNLNSGALSSRDQELLGLRFAESPSVEDYLSHRE